MVEGYRWQMVPTYTLAFLIFIFTLRNLKITIRPRTDEAVHERNWFRIIGTTLGLLLLILSALPPVLIPVMVLPDPTGSYTIGTKYLHFIDNNVKEGFVSESTKKREITAQVWYPANPIPNAKPEPYWDNADELSAIFTKRVSLMMKTPSFWLSHNSLTKTHSYLDAPFLNDKHSFPVLIYSHGFFFGVNKDNTALMEELASHGYIVFAIAHAYDAPFFIYPDKTIKSFDDRNEPLFSRLERYMSDKYLNSLSEKLKGTKNTFEQLEILKEINSNSNVISWQEGLRERIADVRFLIDELEEMNRGSGMFAGKLDLERLGVIGLSYGGTTAYRVCLVDKRIKAGVNMDGFTASCGMLGANLTQPFMFMLSESNRGMNYFFYNKAEDATYTITIAGAAHSNYSDVSLVGGFMKLIGQLGKIDGNRCVKIFNDYILAFFDKHLKGNDSGFLDSPSPDYSEVEFKSRNT